MSTEEKTGVILLYKYEELLKMLPPEEQGKILMASIAYDKTGEIAKFDNPATQMLFAMMKQDFDRMKENWESEKENRKQKAIAAANKRWNGRAEESNNTDTQPNRNIASNEENAKNATSIPSIKDDANDALYDSVPVSDNDSVENKTHPNPPKGGEEGLFDDLIVPDNAKQAHDLVIERLENRGYLCEREYTVKDRGDGRVGRIDVLARKEAHILAIEIDRLTPRDKSVFKLRQVPNAEKIILLRGGIADEFIGDIHVISIGHTEEPQQKDELNQIFKEGCDGFSDILKRTVKNWLVYKAEKQEKYKPTGLKSLLAEIKNNAELHGETALIEVIGQSMAANYTGITFSKLKSNYSSQASPAMPKANPPGEEESIFAKIARGAQTAKEEGVL